MVAPTASIERGSHRGAFGRSVGVDIPTPSRSKIMMRFLERENQINRNYKTLLDDEDFELGSGASENDSGSDSFHSTFDEDDIYDTFDEDDDLFDFNDDDDQIYAFGQSTFDEEGFYDDGSGSDFSSTMDCEGDASKPIESNDEDQDREQDPKPEPKTGHGQSQEEEDTHVGESETLSALTGPSHTSVRRKKRKRKSRRRKPKIDFIYRTGALVDRMYKKLMTQSRTDSLSLRRRSSRRKNRKPKQREPDNTKADKSPTLSTLSLFKCFPDDFEDAPVKPLVVSKNLDDPYEQGLQHREGSGTTGTRDSNTVSLADSFSTEGSHPHEKNGTNKVIVVTEDASTRDPQAETTHEKPSTIEDASTNGNEAKEEANDATNNSEHIHSKPGRSHHESSSIFENCLCTEDFIDILPLAATNSFDVLSWKKGTNSEIVKTSSEEVANNAPQEVQNDGEVSEEAQDQKNTTVVHEQSVPPSSPPPHSTKEEVPESVDKKLLSKWWKPCTTNVSRCHGCGEAAAPAAYALSRVGKLVAAANCGTVIHPNGDENVAESDVGTALLQAEAKRISNNAMTIKTPIQKMLSLKKENTTIPDVNKEQEHFDVQKTKLSFPRDGDDNDSVFQIRILVEETENKDKNTENGGVPDTLNQDTSNNTVDRAYSLEKSIPCADVSDSVLKQDDRLQEEVPAPIVESIANAEELLAKSTYGPPSCEATISETACAGGETAAVSESQHHKDKTAPGDLDEERPTTAEQGIERTKEDLSVVLGSKERERATAGKNSRRPSLIGLMTKNPSQTKAKTPRRSLLRRRRSKESRKKNPNAAALQRIEPSPTGFEIEFSTPPSDQEGNTSNRVKRTRSQQRIVAAQRRHKGIKHAVLVLNNKTGAAVLSPTGGIAPERQRTYEDPLIFEASRDPDGPAIDADEPATPPLPPVVPERARTLEDRSIVELQRDPSSGSAEHRTIDADEHLREEATPEPEPTPLLRVETVVRKPRTAIEAATMPASPESGKHSKKTQKKNSKSERQQSRNSRWYKRLKPPSRNKKLPITLVEDEGCEVFYAKKDRAIF